MKKSLIVLLMICVSGCSGQLRQESNINDTISLIRSHPGKYDPDGDRSGEPYEVHIEGKSIGDVWLKNPLITIEIIDVNWFRIWSASPVSGSSSNIGYYDVRKNRDGRFITDKRVGLIISTGDSGTELGNEIMQIIFADKYRYEFKVDANKRMQRTPLRGAH